MTGKLRHAESPLFPEGVRQAATFVCIGLANTLVDAALYFALSSGLLVFALPRAAAKAAGYLAGVANSHFWNRRWTFGSSQPAARTFLPFLATNLVGLGLNVALLQAGIEWLQLPEIAAVAGAAGGVAAWNFLVNKYVVFKPG